MCFMGYEITNLQIQCAYAYVLPAMQGGSLYHFYDGLWYDLAVSRTHDLPCESRTC